MPLRIDAIATLHAGLLEGTLARDILGHPTMSPEQDQQVCEALVIEARGSAPEKRAVLSDAARGAGRRPVYEPDSHLSAVRYQLLRLPDRAPAPRPGTGSQPRGVDAVELRRDDCARWNMMNADWAGKAGDTSEGSKADYA